MQLQDGHIIKYVKDTKKVALVLCRLHIFATLSLSLSLSHSADKSESTLFKYAGTRARDNRLSMQTAMGGLLVFCTP